MERTREEMMQTAGEILNQLGGHKFKVMTGARDILALDYGLRFTLPHRKINRVTVILNAMDTYDMTFQKVQKKRGTWDFEVKTISEYNGVYNDMLQDIFTKETGLYTHF